MSISGSPHLIDALVSRAWAQWIGLGVEATGAPEKTVVDPEALIALTAELGDKDARLRDTSIDWCIAYGRYVNGSRLRRVVREMGTPLDAVGSFIAIVAASGGPIWPLASEAPRTHLSRGKARLDSTGSPARLRIRLRAAFGVNARADILAALLAQPGTPVSLSDLARRTRFSKPNVAFAVQALELSGLVDVTQVGNGQRVRLPPGREILPRLRPGRDHPDWVARFRVALSAVRFSSSRVRSPIVQSIDARAMVEPLLESIRSEQLPMPDLEARGYDFEIAFDRWTEALSRELEAR